MRANITLSPKQLGVALVAVAAGGAAGTLVRDLTLKFEHVVSMSSPQVTWQSQIPWVLLAINFVGVLVATSLMRGPLRHHDPNDPMRLLLITGALGGFTSYSSLFASLADIWHLSVPAGILVGAGALVSGVVAAWLGLRVRLR